MDKDKLSEVGLMASSEMDALYKELLEHVECHERWRGRCLNLCAAENSMSPAARQLLDTDLAQRYGDYTGRDLRARRYFGTREVIEIEQVVSSLASRVFGARHVELRPLSGHVAGNAVIMGLCQPNDLVLELSRQGGGHRLATKLTKSRLVQLNVEFLPFDPLAFNVDPWETLDLVERRSPRLIILGASNFLFPSPVSAIAKGLREFPDTLLVYDASHVLGLIAGKHFQNPLAEGANIVLGGTQKSLPGPQGGVIYSDSDELMEIISSTVHPALISNHHLARMPSLGITLLEMSLYGEAYARQVVANARALGHALVEQGVPVVAADRGFTASHMILLATATIGEAGLLGNRLEQSDIIVTSVRLPDELGGAGLRVGVAEVTRRGASATLMADIARVLADTLLGRQTVTHVKQQVHEIAEGLRDFRFSWDQA